MLRRFQYYIENSSWERLIDEDGRILRLICWGVLIVAASYLGGVMMSVLLRGPMQ